MRANDLPAAVEAEMTAAERIMERAEVLASISASPEAIDRRYLTPEHKAANATVAEWMGAAGLATHTDAAGSIVGRRTQSAPTLIIGSHLDTIPNAGRYDGILGVLAGIEMAAAPGAWPFGLEIIGFAEEEGVRFATTLITSRARAGHFDPAWFDARDADGTTLADAMHAFGLQPAAVDQACSAEPVLGFLELHIEQGPVLEALDLPVGVVTGIAGARRYTITVTGRAGHAGTVPMELRRDALVGAAECVLLTRGLAETTGLVATVGRIAAEPGAVNVIAGRATFSLDVRSIDDTAVETFMRQWETQARAALESRSLALTVTATHDARAALCAPHLVAACAAGIESLGLPAHRLPSGAGHDAMAMAALCDVGMLFVRCAGGISHNPAESVTVTDVAWGLAALRRTLDHLAATFRSPP